MKLHVRLALVCLVVALPVIGTGTAFGDTRTASSTELVEHPAEWDGATVTFEGEAIGEAMVRGGDAWIHVNDDAYARDSIEAGAELAGYNSGMPVHLPAEEADKIEEFGSHTVQGDLVRVVGVFRAASPEHGGEMLIEGSSLEVVRDGSPIADPLKPWKVWLAALLAAACAGVFYALRRLTHSA